MILMHHMILDSVICEKIAFWTHKINAVLRKNTLRVHEINTDWRSRKKNNSNFLQPSFSLVMQKLCNKVYCFSRFYPPTVFLVF